LALEACSVEEWMIDTLRAARVTTRALHHAMDVAYDAVAP